MLTRNREKIETIIAPIIALIAILIAWQLACQIFDIPSIVVPTPISVVTQLASSFGAIWYHASYTLMTTVCGFVIAVLVGLLLGIIIGSSKVAYKALYPLLVGFNSLPKVAIVPVLAIWFGNGFWPVVLTAFVTAFFPLVVNVTTGLRTLEPEFEDMMRSLGARKLDVISKVSLPRAMPYFFASLKVSISLAFVGSIIAETMASNRGIGVLMVEATSNFRIPLVFAGLVTVAVMGVLMYVIFAAIEKRFTSWANR